jgi:hypothetical protein
MATSTPPPPKPPNASRDARLAEALRQNLKRRKAAQRSQAGPKKS